MPPQIKSMPVILSVTCAAIFSLGACRAGETPAGKQEWTAVLNRLKSPQEEVRRKAAAALLDLADELANSTRGQEKAASPYIADLAAIIGDQQRDAKSRGTAVHALAFFGSRAEGVVPSLIPILLDENENEHVRSWIAMVLPEMGNRKKVAPAILAASRSRNKNVRVNASMNIGNLEMSPATLLPWAEDALKDPMPQMRIGAMTVATQILKDSNKRNSERAWKILLEGINDQDALVQKTVLFLLTSAAPDSGNAEDAVSKLLESRDPEVRLRAASAMIILSDEIDEQHLNTLIQALAARKTRTRATAAQVLGACGKKAKKAVPALTKRLQDSDATVRTEAAFSLMRITGRHERYTDTLVEALASKEAGAHSLALVYLASMPPQAKEAVRPSLLKAARHDDARVRAAAINLLACVRCEAGSVLKALSTALNDPDPLVRITAIQAIERMGSQAKALLPEIIQATKDPVEDVRRAARQARDAVNSGTNE